MARTKGQIIGSHRYVVSIHHEHYTANAVGASISDAIKLAIRRYFEMREWGHIPSSRDAVVKLATTARANRRGIPNFAGLTARDGASFVRIAMD